jgi:hypothetical protein
VTYLGARGLQDASDYFPLVVVVALGLAAAAVAFVMRLHDLNIHQELRQRRRPPG